MTVLRPALTVAAVIEREGRFLLVEEKTRAGLRLNQPAGHLERGETLIQAVAREVMEEAAHHFTATHLLGVYASAPKMEGHGGYVRIAFIGRVGAPLNQALDTGIVRTLWLRPDDIDPDRCRSEQVLRCIADYQAGVRMDLSTVVQL